MEISCREKGWIRLGRVGVGSWAGGVAVVAGDYRGCLQRWRLLLMPSTKIVDNRIAEATTAIEVATRL